MRKFVPAALAFLALALASLGAASPAAAFAEGREPPDLDWPQSGIFGTFDQAQLKRGYQVFEEVCSVCHSMKYLAFRNLVGIGFTAEQVKEIAAQYDVVDGPDDEGEMYERPGRLSDTYPKAFANDNAARAANFGALPVDLSLIVKARENGLDYIHALLTGYEEEPPEHLIVPDGMSYNPYFPGGVIAMPQMIYDEMVEYEDGTEASADQMARDVVAFLHWGAEPELEERKRIGLKVLIFLAVFAALMYAVKVRAWAKLH